MNSRNTFKVLHLHLPTLTWTCGVGIRGSIFHSHSPTESSDLVRDLLHAAWRKQFKLNIPKMEMVVVSQRSRPPPYNQFPFHSEVVSSYRYLGLQLTHNLDWQSTVMTCTDGGGVDFSFWGGFIRPCLPGSSFMQFWEGSNTRKRYSLRQDKVIKWAESAVGLWSFWSQWWRGGAWRKCSPLWIQNNCYERVGSLVVFVWFTVQRGLLCWWHFYSLFSSNQQTDQPTCAVKCPG